MSHVAQIVYAVLIGYFAAVNLGYAVLTVIGIRQGRWRAQQARYTRFASIAASATTVPVSVIVTAFNEEQVIGDSISSMLLSRHPEFEVIVVNDGSTDRTLQVLKERFGLERREAFYPAPIPTAPVRGIYGSPDHPNLSVIDKENGRQADAANAGVNLARFRYIAQTDSDCTFEPDTLLRIVRVVNFDPGRVIAIGGQLRLSNGLPRHDGEVEARGLPRHWVERFQVVEYMAAFLLHRLGWGRINGLPVVAGGWGVWRKDVVIDLGGYATDVTHNDIEITIAAHERLRRLHVPYEIAAVPDSIVWTQAPSTWRGLQSQRKRWQRVVIEVTWKFRRMLFNPRYGVVGMITMPYLLLYEGLGPVVEAFAYVFTVTLAILGILDPRALIVFLTFSLGLNAVLRLASLFTDTSLLASYSRGEVLKLLAAAILEPVIYRTMLLPARLLAFWEFFTGRKTHESVARTVPPVKPVVPGSRRS